MQEAFWARPGHGPHHFHTQSTGTSSPVGPGLPAGEAGKCSELGAQEVGAAPHGLLVVSAKPGFLRALSFVFLMCGVCFSFT